MSDLIDLANKLVELGSYSHDAAILPELDEVIRDLLGVRAGLLTEMGQVGRFKEKYYVYNNHLKMEDRDTFVLSPKNGDTDIEAIEHYMQFTDDKQLSSALRDWVSSYKNETCRHQKDRICPIVGSNLCCGHCTEAANCQMVGYKHYCHIVAEDMFTTIRECEG